jgi:hypothetical protein
MKSYILWDKTPCSPLKVNWRFGEKYGLLGYSSTLEDEDMFLQNVGWISTVYTALQGGGIAQSL